MIILRHLIHGFVKVVPASYHDYPSAEAFCFESYYRLYPYYGWSSYYVVSYEEVVSRCRELTGIEFSAYSEECRKQGGQLFDMKELERFRSNVLMMT